jgi:hypothetical protein
MKTGISAGHGDSDNRADSPFYLENDFYGLGKILRSQFDKEILDAIELRGGSTPFAYAFCQDKYQFLTAGAERIFMPDILEDFMTRLRSWAGDTLGTTHVSTPQVRVYIQGCSRDLLRDGVSARWHYMLSLTRTVSRKKLGGLKLLPDPFQVGASGEVLMHRTVTSSLQFNQLLVHKTCNAYGVELSKTSMNPLEGAVFLDGYLW